MDTTFSSEYIREQQLHAARVRLVARQREALEVARVYAAYRHLDENPDWNLILNYWIERIMLQQHTTEQATGMHNFLVMVLDDMKKANSVPPTFPMGTPS